VLEAAIYMGIINVYDKITIENKKRKYENQ